MSSPMRVTLSSFSIISDKASLTAVRYVPLCFFPPSKKRGLWLSGMTRALASSRVRISSLLAQASSQALSTHSKAFFSISAHWFSLRIPFFTTKETKKEIGSFLAHSFSSSLVLYRSLSDLLWPQRR